MIPKRVYFSHDGEYKYLTKNCEECVFFRKFENFTEKLDLVCGVGKHFRYLVERDTGPRKCEFFSFEIVGLNKTMKYLNYLKNLRRLGRSRLLRHVDLKKRYRNNYQLSLPFTQEKI